MTDFILRYWVEEVFAAIIAVLAWLVRQVKGKKKGYRMVNEAIMALLHDRLYQACSFYISKGWCSVDDRENLEYLYRPYKELGGNGTGEDLYHKVMDLPLSDPAGKTETL